MSGARRRWPSAVVVVIGLLTSACSGGGGSTGDGEDLAGQGEIVVQFEGAAKLRMGGTLALPSRPGGGPVAGVLIVPSLARNDRNGAIDVIPADLLYQDLSKAVTGAGMAAFRYDRRSMGTSKLEAGQQLSFEDMVADAHQALLFLSQRSGIDGSNLAIVGHDLGGIVAMRVAAIDDRVKSVVLLSTPGRPLVDVMAGGFEASHGPESAQAFRATIDHLLATGSLPERGAIRPEHQSSLPVGQDAVLRAAYGLDPASEATKLRVPALVVTGTQSALVNGADAERLKTALSSAQVVSADTNASLQKVATALPQSFDPNDHRAHGGGRPPDTATRDQSAMDQIAAFIGSKAAAPRQ